MQFTVAAHDDFIGATGAGPVSATEVLRFLTTAIDTGAEQGFHKILVDLSAATGELSITELYTVGQTIAEYCIAKSLYTKLAVIGKPPTVTGFGAESARIRGLISRTFLEREEALNWLLALPSKTQSA
jgi:hypothetical protein